MHLVTIPEDQVTPLDYISPGVQGLRIIFVNVFTVAHKDGSWTLIDAGLPMAASYIRHWAEKSFAGPPNAIVLTHGHFDHVSSARLLLPTIGMCRCMPILWSFPTSLERRSTPNRILERVAG